MRKGRCRPSFQNPCTEEDTQTTTVPSAKPSNTPTLDHEVPKGRCKPGYGRPCNDEEPSEMESTMETSSIPAQPPVETPIIPTLDNETLENVRFYSLLFIDFILWFNKLTFLRDNAG